MNYFNFNKQSSFEDLCLDGSLFTYPYSSAEKKLENKYFNNCTFIKCSFEIQNFVDSEFRNCQFISCYFKNCTFYRSNFCNSNFICSNLNNCDFYKTDFNGLTLTGNIFTSCKFQKVVFRTVSIQKEELTFSTFSNTEFKIPSSSNKLESTVFEKCIFVNADELKLETELHLFEKIKNKTI